MSDLTPILTPIVVAAISGAATIICEIIRRPRDPKESVRSVTTQGTVQTDATELKRTTIWKSARNVSLLLFVIGASISLWSLVAPLLHAHSPPLLGSRGPEIIIVQVPPAEAEGGPEKSALIAGVVSGVAPADFRVVIYSYTDHWYVQPFIGSELTGIDSGGRWDNETHLGKQYAALLVKPSFAPPTVCDALPSSGGDVVASVIVNGK